MIFLLGSLGDTVVALPSLHLIARRFPSAQRRVLSDLGVNAKAVAMASLLDGTGLVHGYYAFPAPSKDRSRFRPLMALAREIRAWRPDILLYLHEQRGPVIALRDAALFRMLGIPRTIGVPLTPAMRRTVVDEQSGRLEHRSEHLARRLAMLGDSRPAERSSWDLKLSSLERGRAETALKALRSCPGSLAMSIGTKSDTNDWGDHNWRALLDGLSDRLPRWGLVALGAQVERGRSSELLTAWRGPSVNLCGSLSVRESAAVLACLPLFVGHDSGPMHLAAAVGTPCAAIFSARNLPGRWFPYGPAHTVFYKQTECAGCRLDVCIEFKKKCIAAVTVREVSDAVVAMLSANYISTLNKDTT